MIWKHRVIQDNVIIVWKKRIKMKCCGCQKSYEKKKLIAQKTIFNRYEYYCQECYDNLIKGDDPQ